MVMSDLHSTTSTIVERLRDKRMHSSDGRLRKKKCAKCGTAKELTAFPKHSTSSDGFASYCKTCRNGLRNRRHRNTRSRLRHHIYTRVASQLNKANISIPRGCVTDLDKYFGYRISELRDYLEAELQSREGISLKESFSRGYHLDHIYPLSRFVITSIECQAFRDCWTMSNLRMIPATENLQKGAKVV